MLPYAMPPATGIQSTYAHSHKHTQTAYTSDSAFKTRSPTHALAGQHRGGGSVRVPFPHATLVRCSRSLTAKVFLGGRALLYAGEDLFRVCVFFCFFSSLALLFCVVNLHRVLSVGCSRRDQRVKLFQLIAGVHFSKERASGKSGFRVGVKGGHCNAGRFGGAGCNFALKKPLLPAVCGCGSVYLFEVFFCVLVL